MNYDATTLLYLEILVGNGLERQNGWVEYEQPWSPGCTELNELDFYMQDPLDFQETVKSCGVGFCSSWLFWQVGILMLPGLPFKARNKLCNQRKKPNQRWHLSLFLSYTVIFFPSVVRIHKISPCV